VGEANLTGRRYEEELFVLDLTELSAVQGSTQYPVSINGLLAESHLDTGADVTVIPPSLFHSLTPAPSARKEHQATHGSM